MGGARSREESGGGRSRRNAPTVNVPQETCGHLFYASSSTTQSRAPVSPIARDFEFGHHECSFDFHESSTGGPVPPCVLFRELEEERKRSRVRVPPAIYAQAAADAEAMGIDAACALVFFPEEEDMSCRIPKHLQRRKLDHTPLVFVGPYSFPSDGEQSEV